MVRPRQRGSPVRVENGWLMTPYDGADTSIVELGAQSPGQRVPARWVPAFLSWHDGRRVAQARPARFDAAGTVTIWQRVNGAANPVGPVDL